MKMNYLSFFFAFCLLLPNLALAGTIDHRTTTVAPPRLVAPIAPGAARALTAVDRNAELPSPVVADVTPAEVIQKNAVVTVRGQHFGANQAGGRRVVLTQVNGGMQVIPTIASWKSNRITFTAPDLSGPYRLQVDNGSSKPLSNAKEIMLGVRQKDIRVDFTSVFGGTRMDNSNTSYFYLGPAGGAPLGWRAIFTTQAHGFPRFISGGDKRKVVSREWNDKKNTLYDISVRCYLRMKSDPAAVTFDSNNHLIFSIPYTTDIYQTAEVFWYNTQDTDPYGLKDHLLTQPMRGMLIIRVPLSVQPVAGKNLILSDRADLSLTGDLTIKNPWPDQGLEPELLRDWETAKTLLGQAIAAKFGNHDYRMSIFGNEFTNLIRSLVGPGTTILRFQTTGSNTMRVFYLD